MLQLKNIVKTYQVADIHQTALKDVSVNFRSNEFVSILGQSGSGKTTLLNIVGGLDRYTSGDLIINGISTKEYGDADWDAYRNHSIGFIFQSYNLIPHQTVLANVELALTLSGVSKKERRERAVAVLEKVGLSDHIHKRPNQMSGGQMQRVAIARALINNPDILLADEPTGALDSETSVQIMDLLKEIAEDKLVIMVTHNPELAEKYSTRIVNLLDGEIISDTNPFTDDELKKTTSDLQSHKVSMSFLTALSLSFNNLRTKLGRTILTAFAGSIGIIGIALILSLSTGMSTYIDDIQKSTMESYPVTIESEAFDMLGIMGLNTPTPEEVVEEIEKEKEESRDAVYANYRSLERRDILSSGVKKNNLTKLKKYLDNPESEIAEFLGENGVIYSYNTKFKVFSHDKNGAFIDSDNELEDSSSKSPFAFFGNFFSNGEEETAKNFSQMLKGINDEPISSIVKDSYDIIYGTWPKKYNEVVLVLDSRNSISVLKLYQLGLITEEDYNEVASAISNDEEAKEITLDYDKVCDHEFFMVPACNLYLKNQNGTFSLIEDYEENEELLTKGQTKLKISGIIRPKEDAQNANIGTPIAYTTLLTDHIIKTTDKSEIVTEQKKNKDTNILSGTKFNVKNDEEKIEQVKSYIKELDETGKSTLYRMVIMANQANSSGGSSFSMPNIPSIPDMPDMSGGMSGMGSIVPPTTAPATQGGNKLPSTFPSMPKPSETAPNATTPSVSVPNTSVSTTAPETADGSTEETTIPATTEVPTTSVEQGIIANQNQALAQAQATIEAQKNGLSQAQSAISTQKDALESAGKVIENQQSALMQSQGYIKAMANALSQIKNAMDEFSSMSDEASLAKKMDEWLENSPDEEMLLSIYDQYIGDVTYEDNLSAFGLVDYDTPSSISIYTDSYEDKDAVTLCIQNYNSSCAEEDQITYTDYIALLTSSVTTIIDGISYVLIAFVAISLIVSCIMIGIITHISVMERTKEIGILRALGASKGNISQVFNAETFIIGCCSGLIGITVSLLALIPINKIIGILTDITGLNAQLPFGAAIILILLSILITILGGLIPAKKAALKDPVIALRTE